MEVVSSGILWFRASAISVPTQDERTRSGASIGCRETFRPTFCTASLSAGCPQALAPSMWS